jgi:hypothetical protein
LAEKEVRPSAIIGHLGDDRMKVDEDDFRRRCAELSDEGLLSLNREEFVEVARRRYDEELARRRLQ